jgi:hypothetical protein
MSGIASYFHGEEGVVVGKKWVLDTGTLAFTLELKGDPHRRLVRDCGSDIGIDPEIKVGDEVIYTRLDDYSGLWVKKGSHFSPMLEAALEREGAIRAVALQFFNFEVNPLLGRLWAKMVGVQTGLRVQFNGAIDSNSESQVDQSIKSPSVFLSYGGRSSPLARVVYGHLKSEARAQVWFDLAERPGTPSNQENLKEWLRQAVLGSEVFVLLFTRDAVTSSWVDEEVHWATEARRKQGAPRLILVNLEGLSIPIHWPPADWIVIDCKGLGVGGVQEELYATIFRRQMRQEWLQEQLRRGWRKRGTLPAGPAKGAGYTHLVSEGGIAESLEWKSTTSDPIWTLQYRSRDNSLLVVTGQGEREVVDPGISRGDYVAVSRMLTWRGPVWMRSDDLSLTEWDVTRKYHEKIHKSSPRSDCSLCHVDQTNYFSTGASPQSRHPRLGRLIFAIVGLAIIGLAEICLLPLLSGDGPADLSQTQIERIRFLLKLSWGLMILGFGLSELSGFLHPSEYWRGWNESKLRYWTKGLLQILWSVSISPLHMIAVFLTSIVVIGIPTLILKRFVAIDKSLAISHAFVVIYFLSALYALSWMITLWVQGPDDRFTPSFKWIPVPYFQLIASLWRVLLQLTIAPRPFMKA